MTRFSCCICFLIIVCWCCQTVNGEDHVEKAIYKQTFLEKSKSRHRYGSDVRLRCPIRHHKEKNRDLAVIWEFKTCEAIELHENCYWKRINSKGRKTLDIQNFSGENVGEYRCFHDGLLRRTFDLDIVNDMSGGSPPKVLSVTASNVTVPINGATILQCRVKSQDPLVVMWLRDCYSRGDVDGSCSTYPINGKQYCYCLVSVANSVLIVKNEYLSKYRISQAANIDDGIYSCVAWNSFGIDYKNITIRVPSKYVAVHSSVSWLFLVPFLLFLIPISAWLCYYKRKKKKILTQGNWYDLIIL